MKPTCPNKKYVVSFATGSLYLRIYSNLCKSVAEIRLKYMYNIQKTVYLFCCIIL